MMRMPPEERACQKLHTDFTYHAGRKYLVAVTDILDGCLSLTSVICVSTFAGKQISVM